MINKNADGTVGVELVQVSSGQPEQCSNTAQFAGSVLPVTHPKTAVMSLPLIIA